MWRTGESFWVRVEIHRQTVGTSPISTGKRTTADGCFGFYRPVCQHANYAGQPVIETVASNVRPLLKCFFCVDVMRHINMKLLLFSLHGANELVLDCVRFVELE